MNNFLKKMRDKEYARNIIIEVIGDVFMIVLALIFGYIISIKLVY